MCPESDQGELTHLLVIQCRSWRKKAKVSQPDSPLFFDTSLPPAGSTSLPSIATVHTSRRRF